YSAFLAVLYLANGERLMTISFRRGSQQLQKEGFLFYPSGGEEGGQGRSRLEGGGLILLPQVRYVFTGAEIQRHQAMAIEKSVGFFGVVASAAGNIWREVGGVV